MTSNCFNQPSSIRETSYLSSPSPAPSSRLRVKVKVFYSFRNQLSTRLTTFPLVIHAENEPEFIPISLSSCLWAICSSSPDILCRDHDLSIYSANLQESPHGNMSDGRHSFVWEGHGLMSWIMDRPSDDATSITIYGKSNPAEDGHFDRYSHVYIELQPTVRWSRDEYYDALRTQNYASLRNALGSPPHVVTCHCLDKHPRKSNEVDVIPEPPRRSSPPLMISPHLPPPHPGLSYQPIFRPEPIFPGPSTHNAGGASGGGGGLPYKPQSCPSSSPPLSQVTESRRDFKPYLDEIPRQSRHDENDSLPSAESQDMAVIHHRPRTDNRRLLTYDPARHTYRTSDRPLPSPSFAVERRSAFTPTLDPTELGASRSHLPSIATESSIPVIYTPSHKKRKKNPVATAPEFKTQQVSTAVRTFYEVDRDENGNYILPVEIDSWTVVDLGTIIYDRPAYHNQRYIYPVNYTVRKWYRSMTDPKSDTQYTCRILDNGREPKFEVTADDCPMTYSGPTPTTVWTIIVRRAFAIRNQEYGHNPVGPDFFGLRKNTIAKMIQDLPNASKCSQYVWQNFEPARFNKPGRNRRRTDPTMSGALYGGVNYSLTSNRLFSTNHHPPTQPSQQQPLGSSTTKSGQQPSDNGSTHASVTEARLSPSMSSPSTSSVTSPSSLVVAATPSSTMTTHPTSAPAPTLRENP
ncbi:uncharacterized protein BYT42DRAFT_616328 [Radiomyces spectabilis]|uniref:uncharacterized protein n=1 Tax=Radiomyces spectabilis TaxID=64574 RepID=UPI0022209C4B|nr:uncharacterized protein BYT42DRAFT_616328 [Radiomyces spectabilis]KAI8373154.1 hypothetical protein BYT42DRAFT_616328 [Radiomyces spectabilis]